MNYKTIFIINQPIGESNISLIIFLFMITIFIIWIILKTQVSTIIGKIMKVVITIVTFSFLISLTYSSYLKTQNLSNIYKNKQYKIVEGIVKEYSQEENKQTENFKINNVSFSISSKINTGGFHKTGKLYEGQKVKIYYIDSKHALTRIILRVDIENTNKI